MPRKLSAFWMGIGVSALWFGLATALPAEEAARAPQLPYDLAQVRHMEAFTGSPRAKDLLSRQGFAVTEEQFRQIFERYLPTFQAPLPVFITVDSAWHTYHVLLEEGVQQVETGQAKLLQRFSERLHQLAAARKDPANAVYGDLAALAAVGWAVQDPTCLERLPADERAVVAAALKAMKSGGRALFFQLPLQAENFRPAGFYIKTPELSRYFVARRWYATSAFRLKSEAETLRALNLALLVESDGELKRLHRQLTAPPEAMVGPTDDPGIDQYSQLARKLAKGPLTAETIPRILGDFRREAGKLPGPRINDQFLTPEQYAVREDETRGMRLFGACQSPSAILFQQTTDPVIAKRLLPSGVDVFAAGPLACDAGRRVLKAMEPDPAVYAAICRTDCGLLPPSLHGQAMQLLHLLHEPLPATAPAALRTPAWQDKQLWTALGAWAEERHTWVLHTKLTFACGGIMEEAPGYVSPYPKFYRQLGRLARQAATALVPVTVEPDLAAAGREWLKEFQPEISEAPAASDEQSAEPLQEPMEDSNRPDRMELAMKEYLRAIGNDSGAVSMLDRARAWQALDAAARRCAEGKGVTATDRRCMAAFLRSPEAHAPQLLPQFADLCDQLAAIADKELAGKPLESKEIRLIKDYGETLARFHFYEGETYRDPRDDLPCVVPVFDNPLYGQSLYVGVGRPEAIYVVLAIGKHLVLHRGAVLSYREFPQPLGKEPNDDQWRDEVKASHAPSPPAWTASFRRTMSQQDAEQMAREMMAQFRAGKLDAANCPIVGHEATLIRIDRLLRSWQALKTPLPAVKKGEDPADEAAEAAEKAEEARRKDEQKAGEMLETLLVHAVDEDVPDLLDKLLPADPDDDMQRVSECLERLHWRPYRQKLLALVQHSNPAVAGCAADVLGQSPKDIDVAALAKVYGQQPPHVRKQYCFLIGQAKQPGPEGKRVLAAGLVDKSWQVRSQAAAVVAKNRVSSTAILAAVRRGLAEDQRPAVATQIIQAAVALGLADTAPGMFARLQKQVEELRLRGKERPPTRRWEMEAEAKSLTGNLIAALGAFKYRPAKDLCHTFVFANTEPLTQYEFGAAAFKALLSIEPQNRRQLLADIFQARRCPEYMLDEAIVEATRTGDINDVKTMLPLFEHVAHNARSGQQGPAAWAAGHIRGILEHASLRDPEWSKLFEKICTALLRQTHGRAAGDALAALQDFDPAAAARECVSVALDTKMSKDARIEAIGLLEEAPRPWPIRQLLPLLDEEPEDKESILSVGYYAAGTVGTLCKKLDPKIPQEAETLRAVRKTLDAMLKGPHAVVGVQGLIDMSGDPEDLLLPIALNRSLPYATRKYVLSVIPEHCGRERARELIPLLSETTPPEDENVPISVCAAGAIAHLVGQEPWDGEESSAADFVRKARAWAERGGSVQGE